MIVHETEEPKSETNTKRQTPNTSSVLRLPCPYREITAPSRQILIRQHPLPPP